MRRELDFGREERNIQQFAHDFHDDPTVHIPQPYPEFSGRRVLTMELLDGIKLSETERLAGRHRHRRGRPPRGDHLPEDDLHHGFYHADPHPGNLVVMDGNVIGLLDFGMVGRIDERLHEDIEEMLVALGEPRRRAPHLDDHPRSARPADLDRSALSVDVADFLAHYASQSLEKLDLSGALNEMMDRSAATTSSCRRGSPCC